MADNNKPETKEASQQLDAVALRLFAERSSHASGRNVEYVAVQAYRDAETFLKVQAGFKGGKYAEKKETRILNDSFAPNLKKTHPHNLVSQEYGDINRVKEICAKLEHDPTMEVYSDLDWDKPTTSIARTIFPQYVKAAELASAN